MSELIQGLAGEQMNGANFPEHTPARSVRCKNKVLIVISNIFGSGVRWPAREIGIMNLQELRRDGGGRGDHNVDEAELEV